MRVLALTAALLFIACTAAPAPAVRTPAPTREPNTVNVTALLDLSGTRVPSGQPQRNAMQLWLDQQRGGPRVNVRFVDVAGSDANLFIELRRAVVDEHADAVIIGVPLAIDTTMAQALQVAAVPVLFTLPISEPAATAGGRFAFALAPTPEMLARATATDVIARGRLGPMLIVGNESIASIVEAGAFAAELRRIGSTPPTPVIVTQTDGVARVRNAAAVARSVVFAGATASYADAIRAMPAGVDAPRVYLSYLTEPADFPAVRDQQPILTWPALKVIAANVVSHAGPPFASSYAARFGPPSSAAATAFDAIALIHTAAEAAPNEHDGARLRQRVEQLTFDGVVTRYSFTSTRHAGFFSADDLAFLEWNGTPVFAPPPRPVTQ